jgi:enolase
MKIQNVVAREIIDSRGNPTVEVDVFTDVSMGRAAASSGASTGTREALELRDGDKKRFAGKGVLKAVANAVELGKKLKGRDAEEQRKIDDILVKEAGPNKMKLGANTTTALSLAACAAAANGKHQPIYQYLNPKAVTLPVPMMNIVNGGKHAGGKLAVQEFMIVPLKFSRFADALRAGCEIYHILGGILEKKYGKSARNVGDEGGYAPQIDATEEALSAINEAIEKSGYSGKVFIGMDVAASSFFADGKYEIDGKKLDSAELLQFYTDLVKKWPIVLIEDPFEEDDYASFAAMTKELGGKIQIIGDDLLVSNLEYLKKGIEMKAANAILLKVNQIGTLTEAMDTAQYALKNKWSVVVSHRSGETEGTFIADLAVALECGQIKTGAPARSERTAKYNRLLRIEEELGKNAKFGPCSGASLRAR